MLTEEVPRNSDCGEVITPKGELQIDYTAIGMEVRRCAEGLRNGDGRYETGEKRSVR